MRMGKRSTGGPGRAAGSRRQPVDQGAGRSRRHKNQGSGRQGKPIRRWDAFARGIWELVDPDEDGEPEPEPGDFWFQGETYDE